MLSKYAAAALLATSVNGKPLLAADGKLVARQGPGSYYPVTGATGGVFPRLEIRDLEQTGEMWNLFLLALTDFEAMDQTIIDSYYQIAGIHGMPWYPWDGVDVAVRPEMGYCPHNQLLFSTWHRPYLMLFEQKLQSIAKNIANQFPSGVKAKYQEAANKLRIPTWDWAKAVGLEEPVYPTAISNVQVQVTFPNGTAATIDNPLYNYDFHPLDNREFNGTGCPEGAGIPSVCQGSPQTIRPSTEELNTNFRNILESQRSSLFTVLTQGQNFNSISSTQGCGSQRFGNIEAVHGPVHTLHFPGHMSPAGAAAFDPVFWLHHATVDRQVAIWQALNTDSYVSECFAFTPTWTINMLDDLDENSALTPFHKNAAGDFLTSADVRNIENLGYTYPDLINTSEEQLRANINTLYGGPDDGEEESQSRSAPKTTSSYTKYLAEIQLPLYALDDGNGGSLAYNVLVFLGDVSSDAKSWAASDSLVGTATTLGGVKMKNEQIAPYLVDLTSALNRAIKNGKTTSEKALDYLKENVSYRLEIGGKGIEKEKVKALSVELVSTKVQPATSTTEFEKWSAEFEKHGSISG
ncbi:Di-copper centre-containing protein [Periconia macrospinosa]|uniref:tyrosinase n=1 Tax=Periconia macrospinosa TaxID=97972 RepID=A0A2V1DL57_9PLEO|nr:Di-copper centre-containing protein [Periconia macrospinosa]